MLYVNDTFVVGLDTSDVDVSRKVKSDGESLTITTPMEAWDHVSFSDKPPKEFGPPERLVFKIGKTYTLAMAFVEYRRDFYKDHKAMSTLRFELSEPKTVPFDRNFFPNGEAVNALKDARVDFKGVDMIRLCDNTARIGHSNQPIQKQYLFGEYESHVSGIKQDVLCVLYSDMRGERWGKETIHDVYVKEWENLDNAKISYPSPDGEKKEVGAQVLDIKIERPKATPQFKDMPFKATSGLMDMTVEPFLQNPKEEVLKVASTITWRGVSQAFDCQPREYYESMIRDMARLLTLLKTTPTQ